MGEMRGREAERENVKLCESKTLVCVRVRLNVCVLAGRLAGSGWQFGAVCVCPRQCLS